MSQWLKMTGWFVVVYLLAIGTEALDQAIKEQYGNSFYTFLIGALLVVFCFLVFRSAMRWSERQGVNGKGIE